MKSPIALSVLVITALALSACGGVPQAGGPGSCLASFTTEVSGDEATLDNSTIELAQPFVLSADASPANIQLRLQGAGTPSGTLIVKIESSNVSSEPDNAPLATVTSSASTITTSAAGWYTFTFTTAPTLLKNTVYWIRLQASSATSVNKVLWIGNDENGYTSGSALIGTGGVWSGNLGTNRDLLFQVGC